MSGPESAWGDTEHLLATLIDAVNALTWVTVCANTAKGKRPKRPKPMRRPTDGPPPSLPDPETITRILESQKRTLERIAEEV